MVAVGHTEACRKRIAEELEEKGDERMLEQMARFKDYGSAIKSEEESRWKKIRLDELRNATKRDMPKEELE